MDHEKYMRRCLQLAQNGLGTTYPNPLVGSVVVHKDTIIGEGWHRLPGTPHGEANAISSVQNQDLLSDSTLYVNLEPCGHFGRTPPCANLIVEKKIPRVVIGCEDPNPVVAGKGIAILRDAGIQVTTGILEAEAQKLNRRFFINHLQKRPYVLLKWAQSADGFIAPASKSGNSPFYISNSLSRQLVHKWRTCEDAILVGAATVRDDDPLLDVRDWTGNAPVKIVLDRSRCVPHQSRLFDSGKTIVFSQDSTQHARENVIFETLDFSSGFIGRVLAKLFDHGICSVMVEGGSKTLQAFIDSGLWDEARVFDCPVYLNGGIETPVLDLVPAKTAQVGNDRLSIYMNI